MWQVHGYLSSYRSQRANHVDDVILEQQSEQLNNESKELLSLYHKTFDDDKVICGLRILWDFLLGIFWVLWDRSPSIKLSHYWYPIWSYTVWKHKSLGQRDVFQKIKQVLWNSLIIHEENKKEIMSVKEFVYQRQTHADLHKLYVQFYHQISFVYFKSLKNTNVLMKTCHKPYRYNTAAHVINSIHVQHPRPYSRIKPQ